MDIGVGSGFTEFETLTGLAITIIGGVVLIWRNSMSGVSENAKIVMARVKELREENKELRAEVKGYGEETAELRGKLEALRHQIYKCPQCDQDPIH